MPVSTRASSPIFLILFKVLTSHLGPKEWTDFHQTYTVDALTWYLSSTRSTTFSAHLSGRNVLFFSHKKGSVAPMGDRVGPKIGVGASLVRGNMWPSFGAISFSDRFYHLIELLMEEWNLYNVSWNECSSAWDPRHMQKLSSSTYLAL